MTDTPNTKTAKSPTYAAYQVRERAGQKSVWTRIGSAWPHTDGHGLSLQLDAVPLDGRITLRLAD